MKDVRRRLLIDPDAPQGRGVRVGVLDSGIDATHPDLTSRIDLAASECLVPTFTNGVVDHYGHGTHIAGIIAGTGAAGGPDFRGVAPEATLVAYRVSGERVGYDFHVAKALEFAIDQHLDIVNFSAGFAARTGPPPWIWSRSSTIEDAFDDAASAGVLCVVAAGNCGPSPGSITRPGGLLSMLTVGALSPDSKTVADPSGRGPYRIDDRLKKGASRQFDSAVDTATVERTKPDVVAPGVNVCSTHANNCVGFRQEDLHDPSDSKCCYCRMSGTSQATAVVTGLACMALSFARDIGAGLGPNPGRALKRLLQLAARPLANGQKQDFGDGLLVWPVLRETVVEFARDESFRATVLNNGQLTPI